MKKTDEKDAVEFWVDARCHCSRCTEPGFYVLAARCFNCGTEEGVIFRSGDSKRTVKCPTCGARRLEPRAEVLAVS